MKQPLLTGPALDLCAALKEDVISSWLTHNLGIAKGQMIKRRLLAPLGGQSGYTEMLQE